MRQTGYSLDQILGLLDSSDSHLPRCMLLNELGEIALGGDIIATEKMKEIFSSALDNMSDIFISFCWLGRLYEEFNNPDLMVILAEFVNNSDNSRTVGILSIPDESERFVSLFSR